MNPSQAPRPRRYKLSKPKLNRRYDVKADGSNGNNSPVLFVVDISTFTPNKPNLTMHAGSDLKSNPPAVACSHFPHAGRSFKLGLGDPANPASITWEEVNRDGLSNSRYDWSVDIPGSRERIPVVWKRTSNVAVEGMSTGFWNGRDWKLVDPRGNVLAVFTHSSGLTSGGILQINVDFGMRFDHAVLMTVITLYEYTRRRRNAAAAASSGGG